MKHKHPTEPTADAGPRAHHFVPQCWLAGFTESGQKDGRLWVTDIRRQKQWPSSPPNAGHRRDFYRVSDPQMDPVMAEKTFSKIEDAIAPLLKDLDAEKRSPSKDELESLLIFVAIQWTRVPAFRPTVLQIADSFHRSHISEALKSPDSWAAMLRAAGIDSDSPGADYERMREFERSGQYSLSAETEWYLLRAFKAAETIIPSLRARRWGTAFSRRGTFVGSDNPVALDGPKGGKIGFKNAEIVTYPVSRHVLLYGTRSPVTPPAVNQKFIAHVNTFTMLTADEQVYSPVPDFCWEDEAGGYQTDWRLFSKEKLL
jgi:hypothetical protein